MALFRAIFALGQQSLVTVLTRCALSFPVYLLADEKHSRCLTAKVYLPTIVSGRVIWHLGYSDAQSAADESHSEPGRLEYPQYTRPRNFRGLEVPEILLSGNHAAVAKWRREESEKRTRERNRPSE